MQIGTSEYAEDQVHNTAVQLAGNLQTTCRQPSGNLQATFSQPSRNLQTTFTQPSRSLQALQPDHSPILPPPSSSYYDWKASRDILTSSSRIVHRCTTWQKWFVGPELIMESDKYCLGRHSLNLCKTLNTFTNSISSDRGDFTLCLSVIFAIR